MKLIVMRLTKFRKENIIYIYIVIHKAFWLDVEQGHINGAPNETQTSPKALYIANVK